MSSIADRRKPALPGALKLPFWVRGDTNAFFGLGFNILVNVLVLTGLCIGVIHISKHDVYLSILPALGIQLLIGNVYYTYLARRLARKEGRSDVTAMPYGPSVPHMFIVTFLIMLPVYLKTELSSGRTSGGSLPARHCLAPSPESRSPSSRCAPQVRCSKPRGLPCRSSPSSWSGSSPT
jgi:hypothetical protein